MAIAKKSLGNQGNYYNEIKKWVGEAELTANQDINNKFGELIRWIKFYNQVTGDAKMEGRK